jgi:hypothetical protein
VSKFLKYSYIFLGKKKEKNYKNLDVGKDLTEFTKIYMLKSLNIYIYIYIYIYIKYKIILKILTRFNVKF